MTANRPTFRVMKNGYDRFAVDDAVERYAAQVNQLEQKIMIYQDQLVESTRQLEEMKNRYQEVMKTLDARTEAADNIARLSLREANEIIATAQKNADEIIHEAVVTARLILMDLSKLYNDAGTVKEDMNDQLQDLLKQLDEFKLPQMPDMKWLEEAEEKLR